MSEPKAEGTPSANQMNDWLVLKFEHTPNHRWAISITYGRDGIRKFHRRYEAPNFKYLFRR